MEAEEKDGSWERERIRLEGLLRRREEASAPGFGRKIRVHIGTKLVRRTQMRILTGTGLLKEVRTWLRVE